MKGDEDRRRNQTARVEVRRMGRSGKKVRGGDDRATSEEERERERSVSNAGNSSVQLRGLIDVNSKGN